MQPKLFTNPEAALADLPSGATVMVGGWNGAGVPVWLLRALAGRDAGGLTLVCEGDNPMVADLIGSGVVSRLVCPPLDEHSWERIRGAGVEVEPLAAGVLAERIRAAGAGIGGVVVGLIGEGSVGAERQELDGQQYAVEWPLRADYALLRAHKADTLGNLLYQGNARNWNPTMATAADVVVVEVDEVVDAGELDAEAVITPGIFIDRIVCSQLPNA